jgi:hypothetical protein
MMQGVKLQLLPRKKQFRIIKCIHNRTVHRHRRRAMCQRPAQSLKD